MSIEKLDFSSVKQANKLFTTYLNEVIQNIKDPTVIGLYCYLGTLPPTWDVNVTHLMNHFALGRDKVKRILTWLKNNHLLEYEQERNHKGSFVKWAIVIKDGFDFLIHHGLINTTIPKTSTMGLPTIPETQSLGNPVTGKSAPIKNIDNRNINTERERPLSSSPKLISSRFKPSQEQIEFAKVNNLDISSERSKFIEYYQNKGEKKIKWRPAFTNWLVRSAEYKEQKSNSKSIYRDKSIQYSSNSKNNEQSSPLNQKKEFFTASEDFKRTYDPYYSNPHGRKLNVEVKNVSVGNCVDYLKI